jgi:hypothetical protein
MSRWTLLAAAALLAAAMWTPPAAAQTLRAAADQAITYQQYRDFRLHIIAQRQASLARRLAVPELGAEDRARLERQKAYYDRFANISEEERDRLFRDRFDEIDANHDGTLDPQERAAWRAQQRDYYRQLAAERRAADEPH